MMDTTTLLFPSEDVPPRPPPDLVLPFGPRTFLALVGSFVLVFEVLYSTGQKAGEQDRGNNNDAISKKEGDQNQLQGNIYRRILLSSEEWRMIGWTIYAVSHLIPSDNMDDAFVTAKITMISNVTAFASALVLGWMLCTTRANTGSTTVLQYWGSQPNNNEHNNAPFLLVLAANSMLLTIVGGPGNQLLLLCRVMGMLAIMASLKILGNIRKLGDSWERFARPNPLVYHAGGPMLILGWFLFLIGTTAVTGDNFQQFLLSSSSLVQYIPIYLTLRLQLLLAAGLGMVPIVMLLDEGPELTSMVSDGMVDSMDGSMRMPYFS